MSLDQDNLKSETRFVIAGKVKRKKPKEELPSETIVDSLRKEKGFDEERRDYTIIRDFNGIDHQLYYATPERQDWNTLKEYAHAFRQMGYPAKITREKFEGKKHMMLWLGKKQKQFAYDDWQYIEQIEG